MHNLDVANVEIRLERRERERMIKSNHTPIGLVKARGA